MKTETRPSRWGRFLTCLTDGDSSIANPSCGHEAHTVYKIRLGSALPNCEKLPHRAHVQLRPKPATSRWLIRSSTNPFILYLPRPASPLFAAVNSFSCHSRDSRASIPD